MSGTQDGNDTSSAHERPRWEVYSDENGSMYFYNTITGETAWELPEARSSDDESPTDNKREEYLAESVAMTSTGDAIVSNYVRDGDGNLMEVTVVRPRQTFSEFQIAIEVIEVMIRLVDTVEDRDTQDRQRQQKKKKFVSAAAEARAKKNEANREKKAKRERIIARTTYMNLLIPPVSTTSAVTAVTEGRRPVGALFSREDAKRWRIEREVQQIRQRYATRKMKTKHREQVRVRATHDVFLRKFRNELMMHFIAQISCSSELQQQRILLMTSPQQLAEMELQRKATLEPELLERYEAEKTKAEESMVKNVQKVFVLADHAGTGSIHLLEALFTAFSNERAQKYAKKVQGLAELLNHVEIQRFVVDFVSSHHASEARVTLADFQDFVRIIDEVLYHYNSVRAAVKEAEEEMVAALEAAASGSSTSGSLLRARLNMTSKKKVEHEMAQLKATQLQLESKRKQEKLSQWRSFDPGDSINELLMPKEEWEKHHHHRFVQIADGLPVYCCLCRRRKWEEWRLEAESDESEYRATYTNRYALKMKKEELRLMDEDDKSSEPHDCAQPVQDISSVGKESPSFTLEVAATDTRPESDGDTDGDEDDREVRQVVRLLVIMTERIHSQDAMKDDPKEGVRSPQRHYVKQLQTGSPRKRNKKKKRRISSSLAKDGKMNEDEDIDELQAAMKQFEMEERERKLLHAEDSAMHIYLERHRRTIERPFLMRQDAAHNAYIRLLSHCVNPCSLLYRLQFERSLLFDTPQRLVALMTDPAISTDSRLGESVILRTIQCSTEQEAQFIVYQISQLRTKLHANPFVTRVLNCSRRLYQFFAQSGMLVECWPVVFVVTEYHPDGTWRDVFSNAITERAIGSLHTFEQAQQQIIRTFRAIAAGLSMMHSNGILHLNLNLGNVYVVDRDMNKVRLGGMLACKYGYDESNLHRGDMSHCMNAATAPPEILVGQPVSGKADVWMLGCALYDALMIWQRHELRQRNIELDDPVNHAIRLKKVPDILQQIPLATCAPLRSLLRMLLQPNPSQRPQMSQIVDILSFAQQKQPS